MAKNTQTVNTTTLTITEIDSLIEKLLAMKADLQKSNSVAIVPTTPNRLPVSTPPKPPVALVVAEASKRGRKSKEHYFEILTTALNNVKETRKTEPFRTAYAGLPEKSRDNLYTAWVATLDAKQQAFLNKLLEKLG